MTRTILSLCDYSGEWPRPYADAGYSVIQVDIKRGGPWGGDVLELAKHVNELPPIHGILAAPPCTDFAGSGARWWPGKDARGDTAKSVALVRACIAIIEAVKPAWWALENPVGRLQRCVPELGKCVYSFNPCDFGDDYTKRTLLWGNFNRELPRTPVEPVKGSKMWRLPPSPERQTLRSITPSGFARAFKEANP